MYVLNNPIFPKFNTHDHSCILDFKTLFHNKVPDQGPPPNTCISSILCYFNRTKLYLLHKLHMHVLHNPIFPKFNTHDHSCILDFFLNLNMYLAYRNSTS